MDTQARILKQDTQAAKNSTTYSALEIFTNLENY